MCNITYMQELESTKTTDPLVMTKNIILLCTPAILLARTVNAISRTIVDRMALNILVSVGVLVTFPQSILNHLVDRSLPGTMAITIFLSAQKWN